MPRCNHPTAHLQILPIKKASLSCPTCRKVLDVPIILISRGRSKARIEVVFNGFFNQVKPLIYFAHPRFDENRGRYIVAFNLLDDRLTTPVPRTQNIKVVADP